ncbi:hypothetical protein P3X46_000853 [Hevea brasiliensis]|uniref:Senescence domain-containing protein n=1 Tax=Hevea brasiliensis TaxID=3981 RepID=A0ABQ9NFS0_HEVBR|nr:protein EARLY-RESPONSIVE TO DEHYDRATION 7, chloroplastic-like [Hevea brasiliensis]KAJ9189579.1 hypothetical protein P3X46_000853 [Hevea brasiliensis]
MSSPNSLYPKVELSNPEAISATSTSSSSLYPSIDMEDAAENLLPEYDAGLLSANSQPYEEPLITIPGAFVHLIEKDRSIQLACGDLTIVCLKQGDAVVAVLARVGDDIQWPLAKDEASVKLDESHYFFNLRVPGNEKGMNEGKYESEVENEVEMELLNYGVTIASKGQEALLKEFDNILESYSSFTVQEVNERGDWELIEWKTARGISPEDLKTKEKKKELEECSAAYWTVLAPNVEDYSGSVSRMIAAGSGQLIKGILLCGDVTVDRLKWGNEFLKNRMGERSDTEISPAAMRRIKRVKRLTRMSEEVAIGILSGVVKISGFVTSSIANSKAGKNFFSMLPGEIVLASLEGYNKVCDAIEVAGKNVMSTSSVVTKGLVSQRYGEQAAKATNEGLDAAGHAIGTAWTVFKIRKVLNPKSVFKPTTLAKAAAEANATELKAKKKK